MTVDIVINVLVFVIAVLSIIAHEIAHGYVAYVSGDDTAKRAGRLTLNPIKHIDLFGTILLPLILRISGSPVVFGWAKPVPISYRQLNDPSKNMAMLAVAGPITNILIAIILAFFVNVFNLFLRIDMSLNIKIVLYILASSFLWGIVLNFFLAFINLIPVPPLDGSRVLRYFLPDKQKQLLDSMERYGMLIVFVMFFFFDGFFDLLYNLILKFLDILIIVS